MRVEEKKMNAEDNFRRRWMKEFMMKERAERENQRCNKFYSKKIQNILKKT